jgi:hypothetical protein
MTKATRQEIYKRICECVQGEESDTIMEALLDLFCTVLAVTITNKEDVDDLIDELIPAMKHNIKIIINQSSRNTAPIQ